MTARVQRRRCANATHTDPATAVQRTVHAYIIFFAQRLGTHAILMRHTAQKRHSDPKTHAATRLRRPHRPSEPFTQGRHAAAAMRPASCRPAAPKLLAATHRATEDGRGGRSRRSSGQLRLRRRLQYVEAMVTLLAVNAASMRSSSTPHSNGESGETGLRCQAGRARKHAPWIT